MKNKKSQFNKILEKQIIKKAQKGDRQSHEHIYKSFADAVYHLALSITNNVQVAEDIVQNTFINVLNKVHNYRFKAPFGMWLRKITVNQTLMYIRANSNIEKKQVNVSDNIVEFKPSSHLQSDIDNGTDLSDVQIDLKYLLNQLPMQTRTIFWLKEIEGYTHHEIANLVGKSESYSKSLVARTYQILTKRYIQDHNITNLEQT